MRTVDLRHKKKTELLPSDVPNDTEVLVASFNNISHIDSRFFYSCLQLWEIDLSNNQLRSLNFLRCFRGLGFLDISDNNLGAEQLLDLSQSIILRLNLSGNNFDEVLYQHPLFIPTLLPNCWIINDHFITDYERAKHVKYRESLEFGSIMMAEGKNRQTKMKHVSTAHAGRLIVKDHEIETDGGIAFMPPRGAGLKKINACGQFERLGFLAQLYHFDLPAGEFQDYFGLAAAILSNLWIGEPIETISRLLCRSYWFGISEDLSRMKEYQLLTLLYQIAAKVQLCSRIECEMWAALNVSKFLRTGKEAPLGSTARLTLAALIARAIAVSSVEPSEASVDDMRVYFKFRKSCGFTSLDVNLESVYQEVAAPFHKPSGEIPCEGDTIEMVHPLTAEWIKGVVVGSRNGRVYAKFDGIVSQIPATSAFWDGRGFWREAARKDGIGAPEKKEQPKTFITAADLCAEVEKLDLSAVGQSFAAPTMSGRIAPSDRVVFLEIGRETMKNGQFSAREPELDETKLMEGWRTFRGIVEPRFPKTERSNRPVRNNTNGRIHTVTDVVNVTPGKEFADGQKYKRFNVRVRNELTGKSDYAWFTEDELSPDEANRLMAMYREHIASKMRVSSSKKITVKRRGPVIG